MTGKSQSRHPLSPLGPQFTRGRKFWLAARPAAWLVAGVAGVIALLATPTFAQTAGRPRPNNTRVQLPVTRVFNIRTVVSVPDGGTMSLGGITRAGSGWSRQGFGRRGGYGWGAGFSANHAAITAIVISNQEISDYLLKTAAENEAAGATASPNGSAAVRAKADFLSRNIGRRH